MATKQYRVRVYERPYVYENVSAESPAAAEVHIVGGHFAGDYDDIERVEVALQHGDVREDEQDFTICEFCGEDLPHHRCQEAIKAGE